MKGHCITFIMLAIPTISYLNPSFCFSIAQTKLQLLIQHTVISLVTYRIGVVFLGGNFREKLEEAPRIKFRGFNFCGAIFDCLT